MSHLLWYPGYDLLLNDIVRAENCSVWDSRGKRFVDLESGVWCTSIGHGHPRLRKVLAEQPGRVAHTGYSYSSEVVETAAQEVLSLLGFEGGKCVFLCSGSEAVEYGVRVAQRISERPLLMTMTDSYFGAYGSASKKQENEWFCFDWSGCARCEHATGGGDTEAENGHPCGRECRQWASVPFDWVGGFLFEPGSSSGFVRFPPEALIRSIDKTLKDSGGLFLVNEVTTGIGRTGRWFGHQHYPISPDIVALGKGIGNGYPVAVAAFSPRAVERMADPPIRYAQSHQNDPLGAAVALEVIRTIREEGLIERGQGIARILRHGLEEIRSRTGRIRAVRSRGLMTAVELDDDTESGNPEESYTGRVFRDLLERGYIVARRPGTNVFRIDPALTIERADVEGFLAAFEKALKVGAPDGLRSA